MGLKSLMQELKNRASVPPVSLEKSAGGTPEPACIKAMPCVPYVPLHFAEDSELVPIGEAANAPSIEEPETLANPSTWRGLAQAYHVHHFGCLQCVAAGHGAGYGPRCEVGLALWNIYQNSGTPPWQQHIKAR